MPLKTEGRYAGGFLVSEGNGSISRENITVITGQNLKAGAALGKITASGKYTALNPAAADGSQTWAGFLYEPTDASSADTKASAIVRLAEVNDGEIDWGTMNAGQITTAKSQMATAYVYARSAI
jgi:hypothetical protein